MTKTANPTSLSVRVMTPGVADGNGSNAMKISVTYQKGGLSWATYKTNPKGFYVSLVPIKYEVGEVFTTESFMMFSGGSISYFVLPAARFNSARLTSIAEQVFEKKELLTELFLAGNKAGIAESLNATIESLGLAQKEAAA